MAQALLHVHACSYGGDCQEDTIVLLSPTALRTDQIPNMVVLAFLTPVPQGQSNVHFAIFRRLLALSAADGAATHIHVLGDEPLRTRVAQLLPFEHTAVSFHVLEAEDMLQAVMESASLRVPPLSLATRGGTRGLRGQFIPIICPPADVCLSRYERIVEVLKEVKPDLVIVDIVFAGLGVDACRALGLRRVTLAPISSLDTALLSQPGGRGLWKYPMLFTNTTYPVPLLSIPFNILAIFALIYTILWHPARRSLDTARKVAGLPGSVLDPGREQVVCTIHASLAVLEYPHVPNPRTVFAGPILSAVPAVAADTYPDLAAFLAQGRTALVNMGSLFKYTANNATAMAEALIAARKELGGCGGLHVLWKLPGAPGFQALLDEHLGPPTQRREWVRVEAWIEPPALAVLQHPNLMVSVHHGGANSVHKAAYAGVPQVILPQWYDLYTFATRVETLGHGVYANRGAETKIDAAQLAAALVRVCGSPQGEKIRARADELGRLCRAAKGDERAAGAILAAARKEQLEGVYY